MPIHMRGHRGAAIVLGASLSLGCEAVTLDVEIGILYPDDTSPLASTNNVTVTLSPNGFTETFAANGTDFALDVELEPDDEERTLAIYLARDESLLGYGETPPFSYETAAGAGIEVFIGFPGSVATLPASFDLPDGSTVAAAAGDLGVVALGSDGSTLFLDAYTLTFKGATSLDRAAPAADDGLFFGDSQRGATRIGVSNGVNAARFSVASNEWTDLDFSDFADTAQVDRTGAATLGVAGADDVYVFGGGEALDVLRIDVTTAQVEVMPWQLDTPRPHAVAAWLGPAEDRLAIVIGGAASEDDPIAWSPTLGVGSSLTAAWTDLRCVAVPDADAPASILCAGGSRDDAPTADAIRITAIDGAVLVEELPQTFPEPPGDVRWFQDGQAVYAQGAGRLFRIDRQTQLVSEPPSSSPRIAGGTLASLPSGRVALVGGTDATGAPVDAWQVFSPEIE